MGNNKGELFREERLQLILKSLLARKKVLVTDLVREFEVSASTIRLDLAELETRGLLSRTHGGAILPEKIDNELITSKNILALREETQTEEKDAIAQAVLNLIHDGDSIMIDGGSTTARVAQRLGQRRKLTIITTSYHLLPILLEISDATIYVTGGLVHRDFKDFVGEISLDSISRFHTDITVIGIDGVSVKQGLTTPDIMMAQVKKKMIALSKKLVVVADQSKMGKVCLVPVAPLDSSFTIITDGQVDIDFIEQIRSLGTKVIVAPAD
ncbi:MAG: DeoR/GlpR transcriptional regulator [Chloroflexi bacterium]|nr:DeoR/GlpR family DNA-binding transcription regulator [Anaerolineaceae bacterium]NMB90516.1 DeoR/GlpR transcriptional regulator [Chloroflexota bacterium]